MPITPAQQQLLDAILAGTFDRLDPNYRMQPSYTLDQVYGGILPSSSPPVPAAPPSFSRGPVSAVSSPTIQPTSSMGVIKTADPLAGSVALPANVRPSSVGPDPSFDPLAWVKGVNQIDPFTGRSGMTVQQAMQLAASTPSNPVPKQSGKAPEITYAAPPPGVPVLSPLNAVDRLASSPAGLPALYGTIPTAMAYGQEPSVPLPRPRPTGAPQGSPMQLPMPPALPSVPTALPRSAAATPTPMPSPQMWTAPSGRQLPVGSVVPAFGNKLMQITANGPQKVFDPTMIGPGNNLMGGFINRGIAGANSAASTGGLGGLLGMLFGGGQSSPVARAPIPAALPNFRQVPFSAGGGGSSGRGGYDVVSMVNPNADSPFY